MARINFEETFNIYLFSSQEAAGGPSQLNEFLSFLKYNKANLPYKFSFVSSSSSLIPEMTLNENILIDFEANSLTESKVHQFQDFLKNQENRSLERLYHSLILPNEFPSQSDAQMNKICSLIKSLLFEGQFIFFEEPEKDLDSETLKIFTDALKALMKERQMNVFLFSRNLPMWMPHAQLFVERKRDFSFQVNAIETGTSWQQERQKIFAPLPSEHLEPNPGLTFTIPPRKIRKNTAA